MRVVAVTHYVAPYQIELFNAVAAQGRVNLKVLYLHRAHETRHWAGSSLFHETMFLDNGEKQLEEARAEVVSADLAVFNYYAERQVSELLRERAEIGKPWCFWGERPGFRKPEWIGRMVRRWKLACLHTARVPIWGIGRFAVERYQREFGTGRDYFNLPYFSDLDRFQQVTPKRNEAERVFLFSGSLISRKGVDLLARAFVRLARQTPSVRLKLMGAGELRGALEQTLQPVMDRVEFLGFRDWSELPACYAAADVLCVPSRYDGWGLVVPEGLAAGLPVIGTDQMGAAIEFVETGRNGWLIPAGDEEALFAAMKQAAALPAAELATLSCQARESVAEHSLHHGAERFVSAAKQVYANWGVLNRDKQH
jgi:glycosyltransferase involved in cell wall biosynthesis